MSISDTDCIDGKNLLWECNLKELKKDIGKYLSYPKNRKEALKNLTIILWKIVVECIRYIS